MKKRLKTMAKVIITISMLICFCVGVKTRPTHADSGYDTSYSSGSDYSSSSSSSSYSSSSYSSSGSDDGEFSFAGLVIWIIIIIIIIIIQRNKNVDTKLHSNQEAINKLKELLPDFNETQFLQNGYRIYLDVQEAWMNFDLENVHNKITDELFNMYESQLSSMEIKGEQNVMTNFVLKDSAIRSCINQNDSIEVTTRYIVEFYDYIVEKSTGKVLRGNKDRKVRMSYDITFIMSATHEKIEHCPNCGAPVDVNSSGICSYCNSKIIGKNTTWVMSKKICVNQTNL